jgi:hypothetical protein
MATATFDAKSTNFLNDVAIDTLSISHTTGSNANRYMLVGVSYRETLGTDVITGITYNGVALTFIAQGVAGGEIWGLLNPDSGTHNIVITWDGSGGKGCVAGAVTAYNVDQATPLGTAVVNGDTSTAATVSVLNTDASGLVFAHLFVDHVITTTVTATLGGDAGATSQWNSTTGSTLDLTRIKGAGSTNAGAGGTRVMAWTLGVSKAWTMIGIEMKPVPDTNHNLLPLLGAG